MTIPFKITLEHFIIAVLAVLLLLKSCENGQDCPPAEIETVIEEKTVTTVDSTTNSEIKDQEPEKIPVIETTEGLKRIQPGEDLNDHDRGQVKQVNRYLDTTNLEGAVIFTEILAEGRVLEHNTRTEIDHKETTVTTTKTIIKQPGGLFLSPGLDYSPLGGLEAVETTLTYIKGPFGGSLGPYYNFRRIPMAPGEGFGSLGIKVKIHIKL